MMDHFREHGVRRLWMTQVALTYNQSQICQDHAHFHFIGYFRLNASKQFFSLKVLLHEMISHKSKIQLCKILLFDECEPLNLISLSSWEQSCLTPVCMRATARSHTHTHTDRKWVRRRLVGGDRTRSVCHSWTVPSGFSQSECVFIWCFPYMRLLFTSFSDTSPDVSGPHSLILIRSQWCQRAAVCLFGTDCGICKLWCRCIRWSSWVSILSFLNPLNRTHSKSKTVWSLLEFDPLSFLQDFSVPHFFWGKLEHCVF